MIKLNIPEFAYSDTPVLRNISEEFGEGAVHGIVGLNGAGKTTLFHLMSGYLRNEYSSVTRNGAALKRIETAFLDTDLFFYPHLTGKEFLSVFPRTNLNFDEEKIARLLRLPLDKFTEELSTGMKKKLLLLSQLKQDKAVFILDEPFNGLDLESNKALEILLITLAEKGKTVFVSSHILEPLLNICGNIRLLKEGTFVKTYSKEEFGEVTESLFGEFTRALKNELSGMI